MWSLESIQSATLCLSLVHLVVAEAMFHYVSATDETTFSMVSKDFANMKRILSLAEQLHGFFIAVLASRDDCGALAPIFILLIVATGGTLGVFISEQIGYWTVAKGRDWGNVSLTTMEPGQIRFAALLTLLFLLDLVSLTLLILVALLSKVRWTVSGILVYAQIPLLLGVVILQVKSEQIKTDPSQPFYLLRYYVKYVGSRAIKTYMTGVCFFLFAHSIREFFFKPQPWQNFGSKMESTIESKKGF